MTCHRRVAGGSGRPRVDAPRPQYLELKANVHRKLLNRLNLETLASAPTARAPKSEIRTLVFELISEEGTPLSMTEREVILSDIVDEVFGLGPLEPLLRDPTISDILVNTYKNVYVERHGKLEKHADHVPGRQAPAPRHRPHRQRRRTPRRRQLADGRRAPAGRLACERDHPAARGRRPAAVDPPFPGGADEGGGSGQRPVDDPADARVPRALRALQAEPADQRRHRRRQDDAPERAVGLHLRERERIVTIEDAAELQLHQEHVARLETRPPNVEGKGAVRQRQLLINALRMRPDRIVIGETRGEEALDMLQAMNTGHDGSMTTVHANTPRDALSRIETMIAMGATNLPERAMRQQIAAAIQIVIQQSRMADGTRKVTSISEITGMEGDVITMQEIFLFEKLGVTQDGKVIGRFRATGVRPKVCERLKASGVHLAADMFEGVTEVR